MGQNQSVGSGYQSRLVQNNQASNEIEYNNVVQRHPVDRVYAPPVFQSTLPLLPYPVHLFPSWAIGLIQAGGFGRDDGIEDYHELHTRISQRKGVLDVPVDRKDEGSSRRIMYRNHMKHEIHMKGDGSSREKKHRNYLREEIHMKDESSSWGITNRNHLKEVHMPSGSSSQSSALSDISNHRWFQTSMREIEGDNVEDEILQRAIEASIIERMRLNAANKEEDLEQAIAESLKTAQIEKENRSKKAYAEMLEDEIWNGDLNNKNNLENRNGAIPESFGRSYLQKNSDTLAGFVNIASRGTDEDHEDYQVEHLIRTRLAHSHTHMVSGSPLSEPDDWGGLSTEEHQDAIMLEAAMFGSLPEEIALKFGSLYGKHIPAPSPSPSPAAPPPIVIAYRQLREQQDNEYLASLQADFEKEAKARIEEEAHLLNEAEDRVAAEAEEKRQQQEALHKQLAEEERKKQVAAKQASLPQEPSTNDEDVIKIMVRMPDGYRHVRRLHVSNPLQCLYDFMDVTCGLVPGSYKLVRPYPRKVFSVDERFLSLHDLGLRSKSEALFLEFVE